MLIPMAKLQIAGRREELSAVLEGIYRLQGMQLVDVARDPALDVDAAGLNDANSLTQARLELLVARLDALLSLVGSDDRGDSRLHGDPDPVSGAVDLADVEAELDRISILVQGAAQHLDSLTDELALLPRYLHPLEQLARLVPELAALPEYELQKLGLDTAALVLNTSDDTLVDTLRRELTEVFGVRFDLTSARVGTDAIGCLLVFSHSDSARLHALLGQEHVRHLPLPSAYSGQSLFGALAGMRTRLDALPRELADAHQVLEELIGPHVEAWHVTLAGARAELEQLAAAAGAGVTDRAFAVVGWVPRPHVARFHEALAALSMGPLAIEELPHDERAHSTPVLMKERRVARPFGLLTRFLDNPRAASLDPTGLMALFLPLMFGVMVGDVVYGTALLLVGLWARRKFGRISPGIADLCSVLVFGAVWAIIFGFLFGEALGNLGKNLFGDFSLWFYRGDANALQPLLLFALAIGAAHVLLGVVLGMWQSWRDRAHRHLLDRVGTFAFLCGMLGLAGFAAGALPPGFMSPAIALTVVGLVLVMSLHGTLGLMMAPLELLGAIGNILSYLRLAAVGLASVYLAIVANELATVGPLWLGIIVATFFHVLNLALAGFSPMIQALRLHYVEFFSKFFIGGGQAFIPFGKSHS